MYLLHEWLPVSALRSSPRQCYEELKKARYMWCTKMLSCLGYHLHQCQHLVRALKFVLLIA
jgi:hypothetical protein